MSMDCCAQSVERWYQRFLLRRGGHHSEKMTEYFRESNEDLAPLCAELLQIAVEFRVAASKSVGLALMQPLRCEECGGPIALVILSLSFMLLLFRLQAIFLTMIDRWEIIPEGPKRYRERVAWHEAGENEVRQLVLGLEMYVGEKDVTFEGMTELVRSIRVGDPHARMVVVDALRMAESWAVAHEVFHVCLLAGAHGPFREFGGILESDRDTLAFAAGYCDQVARALPLPPRTASSWLEEFQADILACKMLCIAVTDRRFKLEEEVSFPAQEARFHAARAVLHGVAAAFEGIFWVDVHGENPRSANDVRSSSHPPHHIRWKLITLYMQELAGTEGDCLSQTTGLMATLSQSLVQAYGGRQR